MTYRKGLLFAACFILLIAFGGYRNEPDWAAHSGVHSSVARKAPSRQFVYVVNAGDNSISQYQVNAAGRLLPLSAPTVAVSKGVNALTLAPSGRFAYAVGTGGAVSLLDVRPDGALVIANRLTLSCGEGASRVIFNPDGHFAYVLLPPDKPGEGRLLQYQVHSDGTLTPLSPAALRVKDGPNDAAFSPDGHFAYVLTGGSYPTDPPVMSSGSVLSYRVNAQGTLQPIAQEAVATEDTPAFLVVAPGGRFVYVANSGNGATQSSSISQYGVTSTGSLHPLSPKAIIAGRPSEVCCGRNSLAISPDGRFAYFVNSSDGSLWQFRRNADGTFAPLSPATAPTGDTAPVSMVINPHGRFAYVISSRPMAEIGVVMPYRILKDGPLVSALSPVVLPGDNPASIVMTPR